jgi:hypothetical protein
MLENITPGITDPLTIIITAYENFIFFRFNL